MGCLVGFLFARHNAAEHFLVYYPCKWSPKAKSYWVNLGGDIQQLPVHRDSCEGEDGHIHCHGLHQEYKIAQELAEDPTLGVEGIRQGKRDTGGTHQHVREGQVADEEVGNIVHFLGFADDIKEEIVAKNSHQHYYGIAGNQKGLERLDQLHPCKLITGIGGVPKHNFIGAAIEWFFIPRAGGFHESKTTGTDNRDRSKAIG